MLFSAIKADYSGPLSADDAELVQVFIKRGRLLAKHERYKQIVLELKTAERILNKRSPKLASELSEVYLDMAASFLFYFQPKKGHRASLFRHARICIDSAVALDRDNYGKARKLLVALYHKEADVAFASENMKKVEATRRRLQAMREKENETLLKKKIIEGKRRERAERARKLQITLNKFESRFEDSLRRYRKADNKLARENYRPFKQAIMDIIYKAPNPPGSKFLYDLVEKYGCMQEFREVMRKP